MHNRKRNMPSKNLPDRASAKIDANLHKALVDYAKRENKYIGPLLDELLREGMKVKGIIEA